MSLMTMHAFATATALPRGSSRTPFSRRPHTTPPERSRAGRFVRYAVVGTSMTVAYLVLYQALRPAAGAQAANVVALLATTAVSTLAHRHFTFAAPGAAPRAWMREQGLALVALGITLALTGAAVTALQAAAVSPRTETAGLLAASAVAGLLRYGLLRTWVFAEEDYAVSPTCMSCSGVAVGLAARSVPQDAGWADSRVSCRR